MLSGLRALWEAEAAARVHARGGGATTRMPFLFAERVLIIAASRRGQQKKAKIHPCKLWADWVPIVDACGRSRIRIATTVREVILQAKSLWQEEEGKDSPEYTLLLVLVALAAIAAVVTLTKALGLFLSPTATST